MVKKLRAVYDREMFNPKFLGYFVNHVFIIRRGLYKAVYENRHYLSGKLLDFGCGQKPYKKVIEVDEYIGLDIEKSGRSHKNDDIDVFYDGKTIPFKNNFFDSVLSTEVFEHIFNLDDILNEIYRVLKPGGYLVVTMPFIWPEHEIPFDSARFTTFGLKWLVKNKTNFKVVKIKKTGNYVETTFQVWINYIYQVVLPKNYFLKIILYAIFFSHLTAVTYLFSAILPKNDSLYLNNVLILRK